MVGKLLGRYCLPASELLDYVQLRPNPSRCSPLHCLEAECTESGLQLRVCSENQVWTMWTIYNILSHCLATLAGDSAGLWCVQHCSTSNGCWDPFDHAQSVATAAIEPHPDWSGFPHQISCEQTASSQHFFTGSAQLQVSSGSNHRKLRSHLALPPALMARSSLLMQVAITAANFVIMPATLYNSCSLLPPCRRKDRFNPLHHMFPPLTGYVLRQEKENKQQKREETRDQSSSAKTEKMEFRFQCAWGFFPI